MKFILSLNGTVHTKRKCPITASSTPELRNKKDSVKKNLGLDISACLSQPYSELLLSGSDST